MWRHEDVFFGAMGGGGGGGAAITTPEEIAERCLVPRTRCVPACPFMHGTAHWMAFSTLFLGGTVIIPTDHTSAPVRLWQLIAREQANFLVIVGDAFARPMLDALDARLGAERGRPRPVVVPRDPLRRRDPLAHAEARAGRPAARRAARRRLRRVGDRRAGPVGRPSRAAPIATAPRFSVNDETSVLGADLRPLPAGVVGLLAGAATSRSATTRIRRRPRRRSRSSTACGGRYRATTRWSRTTARSRCSGGARSRSTPAARRCTRRRSSRRSSRSTRSSTRSSSASPTRASANGSSRCCRLATGRVADARRHPGAPARPARGIQGAARCGAGRRRSCAPRRASPTTAGRGRRPSTACAYAADGDAMNRLGAGDEPVPAPARRQSGRLVSVGRRSRSQRPGRATSRSSSRSGTRRATGAT